jgi:hypothetical protein
VRLWTGSNRLKISTKATAVKRCTMSQWKDRAGPPINVQLPKILILLHIYLELVCTSLYSVRTIAFYIIISILSHIKRRSSFIDYFKGIIVQNGLLIQNKGVIKDLKLVLQCT